MRKWKKALWIGLAVIVGIVGAIGLYYYFYNMRSDEEQSATYYHLTKEEVALLKDGDIILRHGFGFVSDMIVKQLNEEYDLSHCAILCIDSSGMRVIHSVSSSISPANGVQSQDLRPFIHDSKRNSVVVVRYKPKNGAVDNSGITRRAKDYLKKQIPFDHGFDLNDSSSFYCSELPWKCILNEYGDDIFLGHMNERKDHMSFEVFLDTSRFEIILNHHPRKAKSAHILRNIHLRYVSNIRPAYVK